MFKNIKISNYYGMSEVLLYAKWQYFLEYFYRE